ncbi:MAG: ATP-grasp domain-containing protein [Treponema sp.]|nr:ATP-grasp domain-containing protein [Treponema sp.]
MDSVLILGAGLMQGPAITTAKKTGFKVFVVDADENAVCVKDADVFKKIDLKAKEEILEYARTISDLKAVFTAGTDFSASVSYIAHALNLPAHSYEAAMNASNKFLMRNCFAKNNVPSPNFIKVSENNIIWPDFDYPFVVKPCDNMGGRGCRMVRSEKEYIPAIEDAINNSRTRTAIVEEYMEGPEYSIDALVYNGTLTVTGFAERHIKYPPYFIEVGHTMPVELPETIHDELISVFALGVKALGLSCGAAKADIKYTKNGAMIGEIAGRLSGGYMSGWTYPYSSGLNLTEQALYIACGIEPKELIERRIPVNYVPTESCTKYEKPYELFEVKSHKVSAERAWISIPGVVESIYVPKTDCDILPRSTVCIGGKVDFPRNNVQKCGNMISVSDTKDKAISNAEKSVSGVFIKLKPNTPETDFFLNKHEEIDEKDFPPSAFKLDINTLMHLDGVIKPNEKFINTIPETIIKSDLMVQKDWSYMGINGILKELDKMFPSHKEVMIKDFYISLLRGGLQGAVYYLESKGVVNE